MVDRIDPERQWAFLLQKLRSFPLDWRGTDEHARRLDALGKEVRLSDLYAACPSLRKRVASYGGLGKLWMAAHEWDVEVNAEAVEDQQVPRLVQQVVSEEKQEAMWQQLLQDLRRYPPSWNSHLHKDLRGALLGRQLHLAQRFARSPGLRRRLDQEGGLCSLWQKLHEEDFAGGSAAAGAAASYSTSYGCGLNSLPSDYQVQMPMRLPAFYEPFHPARQPSSYARSQPSSYAPRPQTAFGIGQPASYALGHSTSYALGQPTSDTYSSRQMSDLRQAASLPPSLAVPPPWAREAHPSYPATLQWLEDREEHAFDPGDWAQAILSNRFEERGV
ncbi:unnamed protein product [Durusdinium trenchii]|uniref:Uncharacterized protein n=1 Tax=Durusdinium trenchii TaxID=1381693 RepID=A0ABP0JUP9_9DINO